VTAFDHDALHNVTLDAYRAARAAGGAGVAVEHAGWLLVDSETGIDELNHATPLTTNAALDVADAERWFASRDAGFRVVLRAPGDDALVAAARSRGFTIERSQPLMARSLPIGPWPLPERVAALTVADDASVARYLSVRDDRPGNHPSDQVEGPFTLRLVEAGRFRYFFAEDRGVPVATAMGFSCLPFVSVSNVFVREAARRRGLGSAMTALAIASASASASASGAAVACLEASPMGEPVYQHMGFEEQFRYLRLRLPGGT
jgi:GNAT superfamily N-acetyltransferase